MEGEQLCWFLLIFYVQNMERFLYIMNLDLPSEISIKLIYKASVYLLTIEIAY